MLAVLYIKMIWYKDNRTLEGSLMRKQYFEPVMIENDVSLQGNGVFLKTCAYHQSGNEIIAGIDVYMAENEKLSQKEKEKIVINEQEHHLKGQWKECLQREKGSFIPLEKIILPCIEIVGEEDCYRIKWFDDGLGCIRRRGGNEDFRKKSAKLSGQPNTLNETAFKICDGQSGRVRWNNRYASYHGQWYEQYQLYFVNTSGLTRDIFVRKYDYSYEQMVDLF